MPMSERQKEIIQRAIQYVNSVPAITYSDQRTGVSVSYAFNSKGRGRIGVALCAPDDRFVKPIGIAIATYRAQGKSIPLEYLKFDSYRDDDFAEIEANRGQFFRKILRKPA